MSCNMKYLGATKTSDERLCIGSISTHWEDTSREGCGHLCPVLIKPWDDGLCPQHTIDSIDT